MSEIRLTPEAHAALARMQTFPERMKDAIRATMDLENELTVGHIQQHRLSQRGPDTLGVVTGRLRRSLRPSKARVIGNAIVSAIGTNVKYAGIHEFGGRTAPHVIRARAGGALRFRVGNAILLRKKVNHPGSQIPARAPIRKGIADRSQAYGNALSAAILSTWNT